MTKLNLGCGSAYRPGYVNIDRDRRSVVDVYADVGDLPIEPNSVETIEAIQLLEHFDLVHSKYVLAEWFRVLRPGGTLSIETPDLKASLKNLSSRKKKNGAAAVQWLFGIDSPGLQHKGGFTYDLLKEVLADVGYQDIIKDSAKTHLYAPGMRVECSKPAAPGVAQFMASFRKRLRRSLEIDDSYVLIPLEQKLSEIKSRIPSVKAIDDECIRDLASLTSVWNPRIAISLLEECSDERMIGAHEFERDLGVLESLIRMKFHQRVLTLWMKSRKVSDSETEFASFTQRTSKTVRQMLEQPERGTQLLEYIASLKPEPIELFDLTLIKQKANSLLNLGILQFEKGDLAGAEESMSESLRWDSQNPVAHWNLARIGVATRRPPEIVRNHYDETFSLLAKSRARDKLDRERRAFADKGIARIQVVPISEYDLL